MDFHLVAAYNEILLRNVYGFETEALGIESFCSLYPVKAEWESRGPDQQKLPS